MSCAPFHPVHLSCQTNYLFNERTQYRCEKVLQRASPSSGVATPPTKSGIVGVVDKVRMQYRREKVLQPVFSSLGRSTPPTKVGDVGGVDEVRIPN